jgi:hypothetical protein
MNQIELDFNKSHGKENTQENEINYLGDLEHFNNQCRIVLEQLLTGRRLTTISALRLGVGDLRRRIKDLIDIHNIPVQKEYRNGSRFKEFFLTKEFINKHL